MLSFLKRRVQPSRGTDPQLQPPQRHLQIHNKQQQKQQLNLQQQVPMSEGRSESQPATAVQRSSDSPPRQLVSAVSQVPNTKATPRPSMAVDECYICFEPIHYITEKVFEEDESTPSSSSSSSFSSSCSSSSSSSSQLMTLSPGASKRWAVYGGPSSSTGKNISSAAKIGTSFGCGQEHQYCLECLAKYVDTEVKARRWPVCCPSDRCTRQISAKMIEAVLGEGALLWHMLGVENAISNKLYCPNKACNVMMELDPLHRLETVACPHCKESLCTSCSGKGHAGKTCAQVKTLTDTENEAAFHRLAKEHTWSQCPKCKHMVEKISGCNHIKCRCGQEFCYRCNGTWPCRKKCS